MTALSALLAAVTVAFPQEGQQLPPLGRCYLIGASDGAETSLVVRASAAPAEISVPVFRSGAWGVLVPVVAGTNVIAVGDAVRTVVVRPKPPTTAAETPSKTYGKLEYAADVPRERPKGRSPKDVVIVLDAGHGGEDGGATSPHGLREKDANLRLALDVERALRAHGLSVVLTRREDVFIPLYDRPKVAHRVKADAFVSLHYNAPGYSMDPLQARYQAVYAWNPLGEGLAQAIAGAMESAVPTLASRGVLHANFAVTRNPEIPSCLVEADFITHPDGESSAWSPSARARQAAAIALGIVTWCELGR